MSEKFELEVAGRTLSIEIGAMVFILQLTESEAKTAEVSAGLAAMFGIDESAIRQSPLALLGTPEQLVAQLEERRDRWGVGLVIVPGAASEVIEEFGKQVISRLS